MPRDDYDERDDHDATDELTEMPAALAEPDEQTFWSTYSPRFEMPISYTGSALAIASCIGLLALLLTLSIRGDKDKPGATLGLVDDGTDETGLGNAGDGGVVDPITVGYNTPSPEDIKNILPDPNMSLPDVTDNIRKDIQLDDPNARLPIAAQNAAAISSLDKELRDKIYGRQQGSGGPNSKGSEGVGTGDGGIGADSTKARSLRWVMRFKTTGGRDYLTQLSSFGAIIITPLSNEPKSSYIFRDLMNPKPGTRTTDDDLAKLSTHMKFMDYAPKSVQQIREGLGLDYTPKLFIAYFPKEVEDRMQRMEKGYQNRRSEDIDETVFEVVQRNGKYEMFVASQKLRK